MNVDMLHAHILDDVRVIVPRGHGVEEVTSQPAWTPFRKEAVAFVSALSSAILRNPEFRNFPELVAFAHQMRPKKLESILETLGRQTDGAVIRGRGVILHFAPANVDTIFLYSLILSMLAGNANIVRISNKKSDQVDIILNLLDELTRQPEHLKMGGRMAIVRYDHSDAITGWLSSIADVRVIWGGDSTVEAIRSHPLRPAARELTFPDRWSLAVFDAKKVEEEVDRLAYHFANDAYWFAQLACSSPRGVVWLGGADTAARVSKKFFDRLEMEATRHERFLSPSDFVSKRLFEDTVAAHKKVKIRMGNDNLVSVIDLQGDEIPAFDVHCGGGLFYNIYLDSLADLQGILSNKAHTIVSAGILASEWRSFISQPGVIGVDRIVEVGQALTFSSVWDGVDLMREFTRLTVVDLRE